MSTYTVLAAPAQFTHEQKRSTFIALLSPVQTREQDLQRVEEVREEIPGARHYCWAYVLGSTDQPRAQAFSDDGEPGGTAGKPILNVLQQRGVGDSLAVVVRWFGGIKLGAGGLVRAYGAAVSGAVNLANLAEVSPSTEVEIAVGFAMEERLRHLLTSYQLAPHAVDYSDRVTLRVSVPEAELHRLEREASNMAAGDMTWRECG